MSNEMDSMSFDQAARTNSKFLSKEDAGEDGVILTVRSFSSESLEREGRKDQKTILHFFEDVKPMVMGSTTLQQLSAATGAKTLGEAKGKQIIVFHDTTVMFGTERRGGLRIRKYSTAQPKAAPSRQFEPDKDIPF